MFLRIAIVTMATAVFALADHELERIREADKVLQEILAVPDKGIPEHLLERAHCMVIVPGMKKAGFIVGGRYGVGVATCRKPGAKLGWTSPSTVRIEGGSFGLQIGGGEVDVVLMVMNARGADKLMKSEFTLGGEASAMAGPVGRSAKAETDAYMQAEIISYSRSRGLFAGAEITGATLRSDDDANKVLYGQAISHEAILKGKAGKTPAVAQPLLARLSRFSPMEVR